MRIQILILVFKGLMFLPSQWILVLPPTFTSATACSILVHTALTYIQNVTPHFQAQGPHSHILMTGGSDRGSYFIPPKNPNFRICLPKKIPTFFSVPKKIPQCFCISKFYYLSSGKLKHANFNFGFG